MTFVLGVVVGAIACGAWSLLRSWHDVDHVYDIDLATSRLQRKLKRDLQRKRT